MRELCKPRTNIFLLPTLISTEFGNSTNQSWDDFQPINCCLCHQCFPPDFAATMKHQGLTAAIPWPFPAIRRVRPSAITLTAHSSSVRGSSSSLQQAARDPAGHFDDGWGGVITFTAVHHGTTEISCNTKMFEMPQAEPYLPCQLPIFLRWKI